MTTIKNRIILLTNAGSDNLLQRVWKFQNGIPVKDENGRYWKRDIQ